MAHFCFVSKYPPIEGQVSTVSYWLARGLAERGHRISVVTNAFEADAPHRVLVDPDDVRLAPCFASGRVELVDVPAYGQDQFSIPPANPYVTKLASVAAAVVEDQRAELLFSSYLEPYGVAADLASTWTGAPHVATHAGSDIGRLANDPALGAAYRRIAARASCFVARNRLAERITGCTRAGLPPLVQYAPPQVFHPEVAPLEVDKLLTGVGRYISDELQWHTNRPDPDLVTFGFYGKLLEVKGLYELVAALGRLRREGRRCNLLLAARWHRDEDRLRRAVGDAGIEETTWLLPMLPNWDVPAFIQRCDAICYLERLWPMPLHNTVVPAEVLAVGGLLITSGEVLRRPPMQRLLVPGETCLVVDDPLDLGQLTDVLRAVHDKPESFRALREAGPAAVAEAPTYDEFVTGWEALLLGRLEVR